MDINAILKRIISFAAAFIVALTSVTTWSDAADDGIPSVQFRNEKVAGLTVKKEIYRKSSDSVPLREGGEDDKKFYSENGLRSDEFRMYLLEGSSEGSVSPKQGEIYTRTNKYGNYYCCVNYSDSEISNTDLIIRPVDSSGNYIVYYYDTAGVKHDYSEKCGSGSSDAAYQAADTAGRFQLDYGSGSTVTKNFSTGKNGEFYLYDGSEGDQVYFRKIRSSYYYISEDIQLLSDINDTKIAGKLTGIYNTDAPELTSGTALRYIASDANSFEVRNYFDKPNDAFTIKKTVNYFGGTEITDEDFTFELLINDESPSGYSYVKYFGDIPLIEGVFPYSDEPAVIKLKGNQRIEIKGIMKNTPIEVREIICDEDGNKLNPSYSPVTVTSSADGKSYTLVNDGEKKYVAWEGLYVRNSVDTADFVNVPNVMSVSKEVTNPSELSNIEEYDFEFEIRKYDADTGTYIPLAENKQIKYYLRDGYGKLYGDAEKNDMPFVTENSRFTVKHGQTAVFTGLTEGEKFSVTETRALHNGNNVSIDFIMDSTVHYKEARPETVGSAITQTSAGELMTFSNTYDQKLGLNVSKSVEDKYGRSDPDAYYEFRLQKGTFDTGSGEWVFNDVDNSGMTTKIKVSIGTETSEPSGTVSFRLKDGQTANIQNLKSGTYRVVETDPNKHTGLEGDPNPQNEKHLFITDVQVNGGDVKTVNSPKADGSELDATSDVASEQFTLNSTESRSVDFTNKVREIKYYFDIEKIAFLDKNVHGIYNDAEQRFVFKIERFAEDEEVLSEDNVLEAFYVDLSCTDEMKYNGSSVTIDGRNYDYDFWHESDISSAAKSEFIYEGGITKIKKTYSSNEKYTYPCSIWNGRKTVTVVKKGKYRITEMNSWSGTDYDFWKGSNQYKGYGAGNSIGDSVVFSVSKVSADKFRDTSAVIGTEKVYRPTASFINSETEYAYLSSQSYAENTIKHD